MQHDSQSQNVTLISVLCSDIPYKFDKPNDLSGLSSQPCTTRTAKSQNMFITLHDLWSPIYATDQLQMGFHLKFGNDCCVHERDRLFQSPFSAHWAQRHGMRGAHGWNSLSTGVYGVRMVWTLAKMSWPGIKFTNFSWVLGKFIKFLEFF